MKVLRTFIREYIDLNCIKSFDKSENGGIIMPRALIKGPKDL